MFAHNVKPQLLQTHVTQCIMLIVLYIKVHARCDKLAVWAAFIVVRRGERRGGELWETAGGPVCTDGVRARGHVLAELHRDWLAPRRRYSRQRLPSGVPRTPPGTSVGPQLLHHAPSNAPSYQGSPVRLGA